MNESADENDARKIFINLPVSDLKITTDFLPRSAYRRK
jgi:predicted lactoylglutathione lyase